ncbi:Allophanate hydrolase 2 subunit 2 [Candidatus Burkholderia brachyanthoides]|nr:Allophanate hydrolase 2 subunit 2 [Candidatus Burkholderia brachyanthoides]
MIDVIRAGLLTSVQDLGRHGYRHLGVSSGGALDALSLEIGNRIVGNKPDAAGIEMTFGPTMLRGPEYASFTGAAQRVFWDQEWTITPNSNRMGIRLAGATLERSETDDLLSHAALPGTIQVPPNGQPIVLMGNTQSTGGYPKIGAVIRADLWKLAQVRLNGGMRFVETSVEEARHALAEERQYVAHG